MNEQPMNGALHQDVGELRGEMHGLRAEMALMRADFKETRSEIKDLTAAFNQGRGALWLGQIALPAITSAFVSMLAFLGFGIFTKGH